MAVFTAVPHSQHSAQEYICDLKKGIVTHFWDDKRLENDNKKTGRRAKDGGAYVLYLAMTFEDESDSEGDSESDSESDS